MYTNVTVKIRNMASAAATAAGCHDAATHTMHTAGSPRIARKVMQTNAAEHVYALNAQAKK